jgi:TRAP-type C4-dicarboxylate transport system permease large subunit
VGVWKEASVVDPPSSGLGDTLRETTTTAGMVLFIIAAASPLAQTLASPVSRSRSMT